MTPDARARLALLLLPKMGPARLSWLLAAAEAGDVVAALLAGRLPVELDDPPPGLTRETLSAWHGEIRKATSRVDDVLAANQAIGAWTLTPSDPRWPLVDDPEPPALLFVLGDLDLLTVSSRVAVVGTRRCTALGRTVAHQLGADLAAAGTAVVSGLALGVDGAAHRGCLDHDGVAIGVVGSGLDVIYPRGNRALWDEVSARGLLLSEVPTTVGPSRWRFPARNRLIAALSHAVVVVESHQRGGALSTADEAVGRGHPVMAVPGSVLSPASRGTNALLVDGAVPVRGALDVLSFLGHPYPTSWTGGDRGGDPGGVGTEHPGGDSGVVVPLRVPSAPDRPGSPPPASTWPDGSVGGRILAEVAAGSVHLDHLVLTLELTVADVLATVQELQAAGLVRLDGSTVVRLWSQP